MTAFVRVVEGQSFSGAARTLGISKSAVSKHVAQIEASLKTKLLVRTTRKVAVTEAGTAYYESCLRVIAEANAAEQSIGDLRQRPVGTIRVNAPVAFGGIAVAPAVAAFMRDYPEIKVELTLQDDLVDVVATRTDVAIRIGSLRDTTLVARRITPMRQFLVASPDYLARHGRPRTPQQLSEHDVQIYSLKPDRLHLDLFRSGRRHRVPISGRFMSNSGTAHRAAALAGIGVALLPEFYVYSDVASGALVSLLPEYRGEEVSVNALYVSGSLTAKHRLFLDFLVEAIRECANRCFATERGVSRRR